MKILADEGVDKPIVEEIRVAGPNFTKFSAASRLRCLYQITASRYSFAALYVK